MTLIFAGFFLVTALVMLTASLRPNHADQYVSILGLMLGWPTLAFTMVLIVVLLFYKELISLINRVERVSYKDATAELQSLYPDARELRIDPEPEVQIVRPNSVGSAEKIPNPEVSTDMNTPVRDEYVNLLREQNEQLRDEAKYWWRRFLAVVLNFRTQWILSLLDDYAKGSKTSEQGLFNEISYRLARAGSFTQYLILGGTEPSTPSSIPWSDIQQSIFALERYGLVKSSKSGIVNAYEVTDEGRDFLSFLDSSEGREFNLEVVNTHTISVSPPSVGY